MQEWGGAEGATLPTCLIAGFALPTVYLLLKAAIRPPEASPFATFKPWILQREFRDEDYSLLGPKGVLMQP